MKEKKLAHVQRYRTHTPHITFRLMIPFGSLSLWTVYSTKIGYKYLFLAYKILQKKKTVRRFQGYPVSKPLCICIKHIRSYSYGVVLFIILLLDGLSCAWCLLIVDGK